MSSRLGLRRGNRGIRSALALAVVLCAACESGGDPVVATVFDDPVRRSELGEDATTAQAALEATVVERFMTTIGTRLKIVVDSGTAIDKQGPFHEALSEEAILEEKRNLRRLREALRRTTEDGEDADTVYAALGLDDMMDGESWRRLTETVTPAAVASLDRLALASVESAREERFATVRALVWQQSLVDRICAEPMADALARELQNSAKYRLLAESGDPSAAAMREQACRQLAEEWLRERFLANVRILDPAYQTDLSVLPLLLGAAPRRPGAMRVGPGQ